MTSSSESGVSTPTGPPTGPQLLAGVHPGTDAEASRRRVPWMRILQVVLGLGLAVALLGWALPHFAHTTWADVWSVL
ncbi:MAG: hypothetical protein M3Y26_08955, partial [Actinomycetota bacterium]|nr:hypothetical protein [Actinomycetota bacterium]